MRTGFGHLHVALLLAVVISVIEGERNNNAETKGGGEPRRSASSEFSHHNIIRPRLSHARTKRHIHTTAEDGGHVHDITLGFNLDGEDILVDLQLNRDLLPRSYFEKYYQNGSQYVQRPSPQGAQLCHYQGVVRGLVGSWAALSTCNGVSGVVFDGQDLHYVERIPGTPVATDSPHYLFKHSNIIPQNFSCGYSGKPHPVRDLFHDENFTRLLRYKRSASSTSSNNNNNNIRGPYNANVLSRYVELVLVTDKSEYEKYEHDVAKIYHRCKDIANIVNALYQPLNIFIALVGVEVWKDEDQVEISTDGDKTLTNFLNYRKVRLIQDHPNDNAQLLTGKQFEAGVVGKALKGPICTYQYSGGVNMDHSETVGLVATTVAHEMGHNFGMEHDTEEGCECLDKRCIMAPSSGSKSPTHWSSCSYEYLALSFERSMDYCLRNKPTSLFDSPVCGNGFVEPGEQCDCGLPDYCNNPCCNASTCMLYSNATCATGHCCDLDTCRPRLAGVECRKSVHECDLPEYCTGDSEYCPDDVFKADGHECLKGQAFCHAGMCRTHEDQCKLLWGPTGQSSDDRCYMMNTQGTSNGNCGYNWVNDTYYKCENRNVKCGMLHCMHLNERLEFGMESVSKVSHSFLKSKKGVIPCRVALVDMGLDMVDPGLAPDGAKCGKGKMCVNQHCMPVADLKVAYCDCNGNGVCNNFGHCHCDVGFAPPDCLYPGLGGSKDSGPASNPHATNNFVMGMFVFFLGIVPAVVLVMCLIYYTRGNLKLWWEIKGRPATSKLPRVDPGKRLPRHPGAVCGEAGGNGRQPDSIPGAAISPRSPTPPSSQGSKSNSPLLNGHANSIMGGVISSKPPSLTNTFFGKHEGFTLSPLKEKSSPGTKTSNGTASPMPPPYTPGMRSSANIPSTQTHASVTNTANGLPNSALVSGWRAKPVNQQGQIDSPTATSNTVAGVKVSISGPSLQASTNPAIAPHVPKSVLPSRSAPPPPPPPAVAGPPSSVLINMPPVAVITPSRRAPNLVNRPLSVPDAATLVAQAKKQEAQQNKDIDVKSQDEDRQSAVSRIASFLTKKDKQGNDNQSDMEAGRSNTLPRKAAKIKRESLMQLEISAPMQLQATELPTNLVPVRAAPEPPVPKEVKGTSEEPNKPTKVSWAPSVPEDKVKTPTSDQRSSIKVTWTSSAADKEKESNPDLQRIGSMRETPVTIRPVIPKFGSMRAPRPKSLPPTRPSEPPPRPPLPMIPGTPDSECFYDDCLNTQDGITPIDDLDGNCSPDESIYATIDEKTPERETPLQEVTYAPADTVDAKKEKKSIFSFLYNKPKKKGNKDKSTPEEELVAEPIYTNLIESPPYDELNIRNDGSAKSPRGSSSSSSLSPPSPSVRDSNRTSCGSSEDGGLLSEIVTELSTRDADFVSTLAKNKKKTKGEKEQKSTEEPGNKNTKGSVPLETGVTNTVSKEGTGKTSKSISYPWRSAAATSPTKKVNSATTSSSSVSSPEKGPTSLLTTKNSSNPKSTSGPVPRGVFSYINAGKTKSSVTSNATNPTVVTTGSPSVNTDNTNTIVTSSTPTPTTLAASLAAVRAAGTAAGEKAAAAAAATNKVPGRTVGKTPGTTQIKNDTIASSNLQAGGQQSSVKGSKSVMNNVPTINTNVSSSVVTQPTSTATIVPASVHKVTPLSASNQSSISVSRQNRPVFPPDKIVFPPDKVLPPSNPVELVKDKSSEKTVISPTGTQKVSGKQGSSSSNKVTSPAGKPGRVTSPTRGTTPTRVAPARNTPATSSGRGEKSRSTTPQPGGAKKTGMGNKVDQKTGNKTSEKPVNKMSEKLANKGDKPANKTNEKPGNKIEKPGNRGEKSGSKTSEKPTNKPADKSVNKLASKATDAQTEKTGPKKSLTKTGAIGNKPQSGALDKTGSVAGTSGPSRTGRISNSHVASLQQKFEKKESEALDSSKPLAKVPSRKSQEVKPAVAPKPK